MGAFSFLHRKIVLFCTMKLIKQPLWQILLLTLVMMACRSSSRQENSGESDDLVTGSGFIRATLDGDYKKAATMMLPDSVNSNWLSVFERNYHEKMSPEDKKAYRGASINIHELKPVSDSASLIRYSNSYFSRDTHTLKLVKLNGKWLVDLKYYFQAEKDSL